MRNRERVKKMETVNFGAHKVSFRENLTKKKLIFQRGKIVN